MRRRYACFWNGLPVTSNVFNLVGVFLPNAVLRHFRADGHPVDALRKCNAAVCLDGYQKPDSMKTVKQSLIRLKTRLAACQNHPTAFPGFVRDPLLKFLE